MAAPRPMKTSDVDILIVPGWKNSDADHWQSRWERKLSTARRIEQANWDEPICADWASNIIAAVDAAERPVVLVGHSCGTTAIAHAAPRSRASKIAGAFLVAVPDLEGTLAWPATNGGFFPMPMAPLPFAAVMVASSADPYCSFERAAEIASAWGARLENAGPVGHINSASGHGPWPEGLLTFAAFLKSLG